MIVLDIFIYLGILRTPGVLDFKGGVLAIQVLSTSLSITTALVGLWIESGGLKENFFEYIMLSVKAKQDWVPYGNQIKNRIIGQDIDYSLIEFKIPLITDTLGSYMSMEYQFTEESLKKLSAQLLVAYTSKN